MNGIEMIAIEELRHHPDNPRKDLGDLTELSESIKANGIMQNLTVVSSDDGTGLYDVIIGNRRLEAAKIAGLTELPCAVVELSPQEQMATMLAENMQREDLTVLEQARGFQYMLDLGETAQSIAERTGFSKSTIRRRVKLLELDGTALEKAFKHQISLEDIDKINSIEDLNERNKLLGYVGTGNFNWAYKSAKSAQESAELHEKVRKLLDGTGLKEVDYNAAWGANSTKTQVGTQNIDQQKTDEELKKAVENAVRTYDKADSFAFRYGYLYFYADHKDEKPAKPTKADKEKEKKLELHKKTAEELAVASKKAYELRYEFVKNYPKTQAKKHYKDILAAIVQAFVWGDDDEDGIFCGDFNETMFKEMSGIVSTTRDKINASASKIISDAPEKLLLNFVYAIYSDSQHANYVTWGKDAYNGFGENDELDLLYTFLEKLGYEMSDEEKQLQNGTHPLFIKGESNGK